MVWGSGNFVGFRVECGWKYLLHCCIASVIIYTIRRVKFDIWFHSIEVSTYKIIRDINLIEIFEHRRVIDYENMNIQSRDMATESMRMFIYTKFILLIYEVYILLLLLLFIVCPTNLKFNFIRLKFYWNYISHILKMLIWYEYFYIDPLLIAKIWKFIQVMNSFEK